MKLLRTIRLDPSDTFVFERAAEPGEWAVSGAFLFADADPDDARRQGARRLPRRLLGVASLGWSTLVQIVEASEDDRAALVEALAQQLRRAFGAPDSRRRAPPPRRRSRSRRRSAITPRHADRGASHASRTARSARRSAPCSRAAARSRMRAFSFLEVEGEDERRPRSVDLVGLATRQSAVSGA